MSQKMGGNTMRDTIDMAREAGIELDLIDEDEGQIWYITTKTFKRFEALVRADEREQIIAKNAPEIERLNAYIKELQDAVLIEREVCAISCEFNAAQWIDAGGSEQGKNT